MVVKSSSKRPSGKIILFFYNGQRRVSYYYFACLSLLIHLKLLHGTRVHWFTSDGCMEVIHGNIDCNRCCDRQVFNWDVVWFFLYYSDIQRGTLRSWFQACYLPCSAKFQCLSNNLVFQCLSNNLVFLFHLHSDTSCGYNYITNIVNTKEDN